MESEWEVTYLMTQANRRTHGGHYLIIPNWGQSKNYQAKKKKSQGVSQHYTKSSELCNA